MKNQCLEIGIVLLPFLPPDQILLHCQGLAQMLYHLGGLSGCWSPSSPTVFSELSPLPESLSLIDFALYYSCVACLMFASH